MLRLFPGNDLVELRMSLNFLNNIEESINIRKKE
jgi:hypothetical protein